MIPDQIHQLGLREIDRIQAEMNAIAKKEGFADLASFRASLKTNPKYVPTSSEQILDDFRRYIARMEPRLPELFSLLPTDSREVINARRHYGALPLIVLTGGRDTITLPTGTRGAAATPAAAR